MTNNKGHVVGTPRSKPVTEADIERMVAEAEAGYDIAKLRPRGGRPPMGSGPAEVVPVRLDPELRASTSPETTRRSSKSVLRPGESRLCRGAWEL